MNFPPTNKINQVVDKPFGENAELLENAVKKVNWKYFLKVYAVGFFVLLATVFLLIVTVRLAMLLF